MQTASILLALGGDSGNQVPKYNVTAAEVAVLRAIHGDDSVTDILPLDSKVDRTNRAELTRLRGIYGSARDGEGNVILDLLYPGAAARVFETFEELDLPQQLFAAKERVSAAFGGKGDHDGNGTVGGAAPAVAEGLNGLTVPKLKELAAGEGIDLGTATKKPAIIAAIEAARSAKAAAGDEAEEDDEVEDLEDVEDVLG